MPSENETSELRPVMARPPAREYFRELWQRRDFITTMPRNQLRGTNMDTVLGNLWFLFNPALQILVYFLMFGVLLSADRGIDNYMGYLVIGTLTFNYVTGSLQAAARCMDGNLTLIRSMYFPRAVIPISTLLTNFYMFLPSFGVIVFVLLLTGETPDWRWLLAPVIVLWFSILLLGFVFFIARVGKQIADLFSLLPHIIRLLFYCSGVLFSPRAFTNNFTALLFFDFNPFFDFLELLRWSLMERPVGTKVLVFSLMWPLPSLAFGSWFFWKNEISYGTN